MWLWGIFFNVKKNKKNLDLYAKNALRSSMKIERKIKVMKYESIDSALRPFKDSLVEKYSKFISNPKMIGRFANGITVREGNKYIKVVNGSSVWGFIAKKNGVLKGIPYKYGDVFKPASWNAPAKHVRGNILEGKTDWYDWTGPNYR
jgi:hypothetical protein